MIVSGKFKEIWLGERPFRGLFITDYGSEIKVSTEIKRIFDIFFTRGYYIEYVYCLLNIKEIDKSDWYYITDAMVFGD